jgi:hypothetical protein
MSLIITEQIVQSVLNNIGIFGNYANDNDDNNDKNDKNDNNDNVLDNKNNNKDDNKDYLPIILIKSNQNNNKNNFKKFVIPLNVLLGIMNNQSNYYTEQAQIDIILEEMCPHGLFCPYKTNPLMCPLNHHNISYKSIIPAGSSIPDLLCRYERPWKFKNGQKLVCMNPNCWYNHAIGRKERINNNCYHKI